MNRKKIYIVLTGLLLLSVSAVVGAVAGGDKDFDISKNLEIFFNIFRRTNAMYVDEPDPERMLQKAADAMLSDLDPYTEYMSEKEMEEFEVITTGKYGGTGAMIRKDANSDYVRIAEVYDGFPAQKAGLVSGDLIISIDGEDMKGADTEKVSNAMKGEPGSTYKAVIRSLRDGEQRTVTIKRERISLTSVPYFGTVADAVGYIKLEGFSEGCSKDFKNALQKLQKQGIRSLIIDLRNNGGGLLQESIDILELFVPKGTEVVSTKGRNAEENRIYKTRSEPIAPDLPLAVLVNSITASSSEIVTGALQDLDRAVIIGRRTFGKGLVQSTRGVGYGSYIKITTAKYYIPSGRCIQALDYAHRNEDGSVGHIPDSLITEYTTRNGRKVYDGGGIAPDIKTAGHPYPSKFTYSVVTRGYVDDFAVEYFREHPEPVPVDFTLSDEEYRHFGKYIADKELDFETGSEQALKELLKTTKQERYYDQIAGELTKIEEVLKVNRERDLELYKDEVKRYIEEAIVTCYHYAAGRIENSLKDDDEVAEAAKLLQNSAEYDRILQEQDTERKL